MPSRTCSLQAFFSRRYRYLRRSEPVAAVSHPPTRIRHGNRREHCPPEGQRQIRHQPQSRERQPKNLLLHNFILAGMFVERLASAKPIPQLQIPNAKSPANSNRARSGKPYAPISLDNLGYLWYSVGQVILRFTQERQPPGWLFCFRGIGFGALVSPAVRHPRGRQALLR